MKRVEREENDMEFMKITDRSIKISLGAKEALEYKISEGASFSDSEIKSAFGSLLEMAKKELGIKLPRGQLLAEVFSSRDGGYEIFVSYLNGDDEALIGTSPKIEAKEIISQEKGEKITGGVRCVAKKDTQAKDGDKENLKALGAFEFESFDTLYYLTSRLRENGKNQYEVYYSGKSKKYYLIIKSFRKGDMYFAPLYELAVPLRQSEIKYIESYSQKITL